MLKIFLILGIVIITSSIVGVVLIIIDKNQMKKRNDVKLVDEVGVLFGNNSLEIENKDEEVVELEII